MHMKQNSVQVTEIKQLNDNAVPFHGGHVLIKLHSFLLYDQIKSHKVVFTFRQTITFISSIKFQYTLVPLEF